MEKLVKPVSGYLALLLSLLALGAGIYMMTLFRSGVTYVWLGVFLFILFGFLAKGIMVVNPNHSRVMVFFGKYVGTVKENGLLWVNPLFKTFNISLRAQNLNGQKLKVNDKMGNPIEIAAVCVWQVKDTYKAAFDVANYDQYVEIQSEAAVRHLAVSYAYDSLEEENASGITLRDGGEKVNEMLERELNERLAPAGISVIEARISHLAYAPEIAGAMLQRQQATAIVAARAKIVEGAVGMVEMALEMLNKKQIVTLDEEKKAAMVSNLMVVLCGEKAATPVLNAGTLHN
ncbi:SPFH domain-containing protein [Parasegetibacter sp. NRK P23]|uniref:SPFH domain-containing protein n=1 Tax=Parasegetibacter sp. NRK P23 TaxID=2942999 RepID=UPI002044B2E8|nr:SPFH domain-containing protein [Parasegetibacter sp. NRK P23]MCM5527201.1 SPFH domain-containing protein [Parasegetibacter sp. NRK P23]